MGTGIGTCPPKFACVWRTKRNQLREVLQPLARCRDSRLRCDWPRDRNTRTQRQFQRVVEIESFLSPKSMAGKYSDGLGGVRAFAAHQPLAHTARKTKRGKFENEIETPCQKE
jgi:hypothetical protein